jgi:proteic killer suppression protein
VQIRHRNLRLERLETDASYDAGFGRPVVRGYRKVMAWIRSADDERDLYNLKSLHYEKLKGDRSHQRSMGLNEQFRLIVEVEQAGTEKRIVVVAIEDYH